MGRGWTGEWAGDLVWDRCMGHRWVMDEREGESQYAWVSGLTDVGLPPWALEKTET